MPIEATRGDLTRTQVQPSWRRRTARRRPARSWKAAYPRSPLRTIVPAPGPIGKRNKRRFRNSRVRGDPLTSYGVLGHRPDYLAMSAFWHPNPRAHADCLPACGSSQFPCARESDAVHPDRLALCVARLTQADISDCPALIMNWHGKLLRCTGMERGTSRFRGTPPSSGRSRNQHLRSRPSSEPAVLPGSAWIRFGFRCRASFRPTVDRGGPSRRQRAT